MPIFELDGHRPEFPQDGDYFVAETATLIGRVVLAKGASIWFGAVLRGDNEPIMIGENSNIQDNSVIHTDLGIPARVGRDCTVGHNVILHGCDIGDRCLIGMGAVVMNGVTIGENSIVGAGAIVTENKRFPPGSLILGAPAKAMRSLDDATIASLDHGATHYHDNAVRYRGSLKRIG